MVLVLYRCVDAIDSSLRVHQSLFDFVAFTRYETLENFNRHWTLQPVYPTNSDTLFTRYIRASYRP